MASMFALIILRASMMIFAILGACGSLIAWASFGAPSGFYADEINTTKEHLIYSYFMYVAPIVFIVYILSQEYRIRTRD